MANDKWMPIADASAIAIAEDGMLNLWDKHSAYAVVKPSQVANNVCK